MLSHLKSLVFSSESFPRAEVSSVKEQWITQFIIKQTLNILFNGFFGGLGYLYYLAIVSVYINMSGCLGSPSLMLIATGNASC